MNFSFNRDRRGLTLFMSAVISSITLNVAIAADSQESTIKKDAPAAGVSAEPPQTKSDGENVKEEDQKSKSAPTSSQIPEVKPAQDSPAEKSKLTQSTHKPPEWTFQINAGFGGGRVAGEENLKSDRLSAGVFAGKRIAEFAEMISFFDAKNSALGFSYFSFSGVTVAEDRVWSVQSLGAQTRVEFQILPSESLDLLIHSGLSLQRMVGEDSMRGREKRKYGVGLTAAAYARTYAIDGVYAIGGTQLVLGSASSVNLTIGVESQF